MIVINEYSLRQQIAHDNNNNPFAGVRCGPCSRLGEGLATLVRNFLLFWGSYFLHLLYHEASHQVLEGVEVADGILNVVP